METKRGGGEAESGRPIPVNPKYFYIIDLCIVFSSVTVSTIVF